MPIYEYHCEKCGEVFENIEIWKSQAATECPKCQSHKITRLMGMPHLRKDSTSIRHNLPDPVPPLRELIGKTRPGCEGGFKELENDQRELKEYNRTRDSVGNTIWLPRSKSYVDLGRKKRATTIRKR